ncbi:MAG: 30S ribosomal protein S2 [Patescibacteria group bacterium]|jgi:small subunit ribosomal protein S2
MVKIPTVEEMLKAGMHFGHRTSRWHPKMAPYIFTARNGVHIIDLEKSRKKLSEALEFIKTSIGQGKVVLFVGTKEQVKDQLKKMAAETGQPYSAESWLGGLLTNFTVVRKSIRKYNDLVSKRETGKLEKYTKKERLEIDREIKRLEAKVGGLAQLEKIPDVIFIWDPKNDQTALKEAVKRGLLVVAVCDTNANPKGVDYIIPANDDATKTVKLVLATIKDAVIEGKELRKSEETRKTEEKILQTR